MLTFNNKNSKIIPWENKVKIFKEDIEGIEDYYLEDSLFFDDYKIEDALTEKILDCNFTLKSYPIDNGVLLDLDITAQVAYLDARTLNNIKLDININESIPFSFSKTQSEELDIDYFDDELNLNDLVFELILVNIPLNYSEEKNSNVLTEDSFNENPNQPFKQIFKK